MAKKTDNEKIIDALKRLPFAELEALRVSSKALHEQLYEDRADGITEAYEQVQLIAKAIQGKYDDLVKRALRPEESISVIN